MYKRKLGTSKKEQGIITPKQPRVRKCGCIYKHTGKSWVVKMHCYLHEQINKIQKAAKEAKKDDKKEK